jgi:hypothetical protein
MECPNCGASGSAAFKTISTRHSHEVTKTRVKKCNVCFTFLYSIEIPVDKEHVDCNRHYHAKKSVVQRLISALYS